MYILGKVISTILILLGVLMYFDPETSFDQVVLVWILATLMSIDAEVTKNNGPNNS